MELTSAYIPMDRRQAIAWGENLPDRTTGSALFADISGFTPLTTALLKELGPKRGPEELTRQLNLVYDALITEVHRYGGSVITFSGDAITCWLNDDDGSRAVACGLAMQQAMRQFEAIQTPLGSTVSLGMKVAIAAGSVRRFVAGNPEIQYIDVLTGSTLERMAEAEHHAQRGEVVVDPLTMHLLDHCVEVTGWHEDEKTGERFVVVTSLTEEIPQVPWPAIPPEHLTETQIRPWLLPPVYARIRSGQERFLTELRPVVALFLNFGGIDYDKDEAAEAKLDAYIRWVQSILARYEAYLLQLTIGDKGSYLYAAFGAPVAHEDDAVRAMSAALELQALPASLDFITTVQIGISHGQMLTGAYGGTMRRTYGVLGDEVNLAARLMQAAKPGQVLISDAAQHFAADDFTWEKLPPLKVKGKTNLITVFSLEGRPERQAVYLQQTGYALPMVGRESELALIEQKLSLMLQGKGQIIGITGDAGIGKTRLLAEAIDIARDRQLSGYASECESYGTNTSYLVWRTIWQGLFGLDPSWETSAQISELERQLEIIDPALVPRLPLLGTVLNLPIPDNDLTRSFEAKLRKSSLEALLVDCLRAWSRRKPLFIVLEDCHWLDPLSHDLLEVMGRTIADLPVLLILAYRPPEIERLQAPRVSQLAHFTEIRLTEFTPQEAERLISLKLGQFAGPGTEVPPALVERITTRAEGNPFYIEELLNYLQDRGIDPQDVEALNQLDLPTSLHSLIISRIDQRTERQKTVLRVASVIGRLFRAALLWGMYPELGEPERVISDLDTLCRLDLTRADTPEPELAYLFKHIVTQEVAYESLPYATRAILHEALAQFIERTFGNSLGQYIDLLAFHYERSENEDKKREYLRKAGEAAQADYANQAAINYYERLLPLLRRTEQVAVMRKLGEVLQLVGRWKEAEEQYQQAITLAGQSDDRPAQAWGEVAIGRLLWRQSEYTEALNWLERARTVFEEIGDQTGVGQVLHEEGLLAAVQGNLEEAQTLWEESLGIRRKLDDQVNIAAMLNNLAIVARNQGDYGQARALNEQALELRYKIGDKRAIAVSLNNLGEVLTDIGEYDVARTQLEVAVELQREIGDRWELANALHTLANATRDRGDYVKSPALYEESLTRLWELGERWMLAYVLEDMGGLAALQGQPERALRLVGAAAALREETGSSRSPAEQEMLEKMLKPARQSLGEAVAAAVESEGRAMPLDSAVDYARNNSI